MAVTKRTYGHPHASLEERTRKAEILGQASVEVGACVGPRYRGVAYQAVQQLRCEECSSDILPGSLFTRRGSRWGIGLQAVCSHCAPFELVAP